MNCTGLYPKDRVISLTQASLTSTLELKGPPLGGHGQMWRLRPESIPIDTGALGGGWGTQAPGGRARTWGHLKKSSLKGVGARVPPVRWGGGASQAGLLDCWEGLEVWLRQMSQGCWKGLGNHDSKIFLQTEKFLIYVKGHCKWYDNLPSVEGCGPVSSWT